MTKPTTATELSAVNATLNAFLDQYKLDQSDARDHRKEVNERLDAYAPWQWKIEVLEAKMKETKAVTDTVTRWRTMVIGGAVVLGFVGAIAVGVFGLMKDKIGEVLGWW